MPFRPSNFSIALISESRLRVNVSPLAGVSGYMIADHVLRPELILDEVDERLLRRQVAAAPDVIVVEEEHEQPDVRLLGLALFVERAEDLAVGFFRLVHRVDLDDVERFDSSGVSCPRGRRSRPASCRARRRPSSCR